MRARRSVDAGIVEDEGLLSRGGDNADRLVLSAEAAWAIAHTFGSS
jgi:hypothetical protein